MNGEDLLRRRVENRCIGCGHPKMTQDPETGFPDRYCHRCKVRMAKEPGPATGAARERRDHKERGVQHLLDLKA